MKRWLVDPLLLQTLQVLNQPAKQHMGLNFSAENRLCNSRHKCIMTCSLSITLQRFGWSQEEWGLLGCCNCQPSEVPTPPTPWVLFSLSWFPTPTNLGFVRRDVGGGWEFIGLWDGVMQRDSWQQLKREWLMVLIHISYERNESVWEKHTANAMSLNSRTTNVSNRGVACTKTPIIFIRKTSWTTAWYHYELICCKCHLLILSHWLSEDYIT
jgi:hypothetical protein